MNNSEFDAILKRARTPERSEEFLENFPRQVVRQLNRNQAQPVPAERRCFPRLAWGLATAICIAVAFAIGHWRGQVETRAASPVDILQNAKLIHETLAMFPNRVRAIVCDNSGFNLALSESNDVPDSTPIYIRVCNGSQCSSFVTFSGQEIQLAGREVTVLADGHGGIILEGDRFVWSSSEKNYAEKNLKIEAKNLGAAL